MKSVFEFHISGKTLYLSFVYPETVVYFARFLKRSDAHQTTVFSTPALIGEARALLPQDSSDSYVESRTLIDITAKELLKYDRCIFHAVSFLWKDRAWLLAAPSGTGKTTQFNNWRRLFPGEISMICGDMPVLERGGDTIIAWPSPWNGKEDIGGFVSAPVGGIVLLEQGRGNNISPLSAREAVIPFFKQFIVSPETEEQILALSRLMDQMLRKIPCFKLVNRGDDASTILLRDTLLPLAEGGNHDKV